MKRTLIIILIIGLLGAGGYFGYQYYQQTQAASQTNFQTLKIEKSDLTSIVGGTGTVRANQTTTLNWQTTGRIAKIHVKVGDAVKTGQLLAELEESSLPQSVILARAELVTAQRNLDNLKNSELARANAQLALAQARQALDDASDKLASKKLDRATQAQIDEAKANLTIAKDNVKKAQEIFDRFENKSEDDPQRANALSRLAAAQQVRDRSQQNLNWLIGLPNTEEVEIAQANLDVAKARLKDTETEWERLKNGPDPRDISAAEARIAAINATLALPSLRAPFNGVVTDVKSMAGDQVTLSTVSFRIDDLARMQVDVQIPEVDINKIKTGQPVKLTFDAIQRKDYTGTIKSVAQVGVSSATGVNFTVTIELVDPNGDVRPGMTAAVNLIVEQLKNVLVVPNRSVRFRQGQRVVYILKDGTPTPVTLTIGAISDTYSQIVSGDVAEGDLVVLNPPVEFNTSQPPPFMR